MTSQEAIDFALGLLKAGRLNEAEQMLREIVRHEPRNPDAHTGLGVALVALGRVEEGIAAYRRAIAMRPDYARARTNLGIALLLSGRLEEGWREYEHRWQTTAFASLRGNFKQPLWTGQP